MDFDLAWLLWALPLAFVLGWLASRLDLRQLRLDNRRSPKAYFKGLHHLLNEQQDQAIDAFIEAVQQDPDTSELHFALGNLFRRRGEYDRAVRVHEHLLARGDLPQHEHARARYALALDFLQAGLLDRAESALNQLEDTAFEQEARLARLAIYERTRDWAPAQRIALQLQASGQGDFSARVAHYLCEQAQQAPLDQQTDLLSQALTLAPQSGRAHMAWAALARACGDDHEALNRLLTLMQAAPSATPLVAKDLVQLAKATQRVDEIRPILQALYESTQSLDVLQAWIDLAPTRAQQEALCLQHLQRDASLVVAAQWLASQGVDPAIARALDKATQPLLRYRCASCGFEASRHFWQCPGCQAWDSYSTRRVQEL